MSDIRNLSHKFIEEFIELYRSLPSLWRTKSKEYSNRNQKTIDYMKLIAKLREVDPEATREGVIKKINSLRTAYNKARKEYMQELDSSETTGSAADRIEAIEKPSLWYYDLLDSFLADQVIPRRSISSMTPENIILSDRQMDFNADDVEAIHSENLTSETTEDTTNMNETYPSSSPSSAPSTGTTSERSEVCSKKRKRNAEQSNDNNSTEVILKAIGQRLLKPAEPVSRLETQAKSWAATIAELDSQQAIFAEKLINDVLFEAKLGMLTRQAKIIPDEYEIINVGNLNI